MLLERNEGSNALYGVGQVRYTHNTLHERRKVFIYNVAGGNAVIRLLLCGCWC